MTSVQLVTGAAATGVRFAQDATGQQVCDIAQRSVWRTLGDRRPLAAGELALEAVEQPVDQLYLPLVQRCRTGCSPALPEPRLDEHGIQRVLCLVDGSM